MRRRHFDCSVNKTFLRVESAIKMLTKRSVCGDGKIHFQALFRVQHTFAYVTNFLCQNARFRRISQHSMQILLNGKNDRIIKILCFSILCFGAATVSQYVFSI